MIRRWPPRTHQPPRSGADGRLRRVLVTQATTCTICGKPPTPGDPLTIDHIQPRSEGGPDSPTNYRIAHRSCNSRRGQAMQQ